MYKIRSLPCVMALFLVFPARAHHQQPSKLDTHGYRPASGYVPDAATAVKIAEAVLVPVYGEQTIVSERPFKATLDGNVWTVSGTLPCGDGNRESEHGKLEICLGGTATVKLSKEDARVLFMIHYK